MLTILHSFQRSVCLTPNNDFFTAQRSIYSEESFPRLRGFGNNIANVNSLVSNLLGQLFRYFYLHINDAESGADGVSNNNLQQHGTGVHVGSVSSNFSQGTLETTGLDLDLVDKAKPFLMVVVFFQVVDPATDEVFYTRAGAFEENAQGVVVTGDQFRYQLQGVDGSIRSFSQR